MRLAVAMILSGIFWVEGSFAAEAGSSPVRTGLGMSRSIIRELTPTSITNFQNPVTIWTDVDLGNPVGFHIGLRETLDQNSQVDFGSGSYRRGEIYLTNIELGLKFLPRLPLLNPWIGAGVVGGFMAVSNPDDRGVHNWMAAFNKETRVTRGTYWHVGLDLSLGGRVGLRFGYQEESINTDSFSNISGARVNFQHIRYSLGLVGPL